jgi:Zn-finger nucleic acid-binding protein
MTFGLCPNCDNRIDVGEEPDIGLHHYCETCQAELVVVWLNPIELSIVDYEDYDLLDGDPYPSNFQKMKKNKGEYNANRKAQEN